VLGPVQVVRYNSYESMRIGGSSAPGYSTGEAMEEMQRLVAQLPQGFPQKNGGLLRSPARRLPHDGGIVVSLPHKNEQHAHETASTPVRKSTPFHCR